MNDVLQFLTANSIAAQAAMFLVKSTLVIGIGLLSWLLLRRASASARHLVLGATMIATLMLPAISLLSPGLQLPLLKPLPPATQVSRAVPDELSGTEVAPLAQQRDTVLPVPARTGVDMLLATYLAVAATLIAFLLIGIARVSWLSRRAHDTGRFRGKGRVLISDNLDAPLTWGVFRPVILLPASASTWCDSDRENALLHELAHIERKDWAIQLIARTICALYWFNPLAWIALRQLILEAELAADDRVLASGAAPDSYAEQLVTLTRNTHRSKLPLAATTMAERSMLARRVHAILNSGGRSMTITTTTKYALLTLVSVSALTIGSANLVAAPQDDEETVYTLVADSNAPALIKAAARGDNDEVKRMLTEGADVNEVWRNRGDHTDFARTALTNAAGAGHLDVVTTLLDAGAPVDRVVRGDATALIAATLANHYDITQLLVARGADANLAVRGDGSPLIAAARAGNPDAVRLLLQHGADPDLYVRGDENPLYHTARNGNVEILELLIDAGVDVNQEWRGDGTALIVATQNGHTEAAEILMRAGARADQGVLRDGNAMIIAAQRGDTELLRTMIDTGADVNAVVEGDGSPLIQAARNGHTESVATLLQAGADIDLVVPGDENALIGAAGNGDAEMVDYLLRSGADPTIVARSYGQRRTALSQARKGGHEDVIRLLEGAGAIE